MKKGIKYFLISIISFALLESQVLATSDYYLPERNTYYHRSQHTYGFTYNDEVYTHYAPSIYVLLSNKDEAAVTDKWNFEDKYTIPYNIEENKYNIALCADLEVDIDEVVPYDKITLDNSSYINSDIKSHLSAIAHHGYPFISKDEMIKELLVTGILVYKDVEVEDPESHALVTKKILTTKDNDEAKNDITEDELLSATQMAIYHYTDSDLQVVNYTGTSELTARMVLRQAGEWKNVYPEGYHEEVNKNITTLYNYLVNLNETVRPDTKITNAIAKYNNGAYDLYVTLNNKVSDKSTLKLSVTNNNKAIGSYDVKNLQYKNGNYIIPNVKEINKTEIKLTGEEYIQNGIWIYEAQDVKSAQTLIGRSSDSFEIVESAVYVADMPNTSDSIMLHVITLVASLLIITFIIMILKKTNNIKKAN